MGGGSSSAVAAATLIPGKASTGNNNPYLPSKEDDITLGSHRDKHIINLMLPVYYTSAPITKEEFQAARDSWKAIIDDSAINYAKLKNDSEEFVNLYPSGLDYFASSFYKRLFDIHPMARHMFRNMTSQQKFLIQMISLALTELEEVSADDAYDDEAAAPAKKKVHTFTSTLQKLAEVHNERGVKAVEYGVVGEVLFWAIRHVIGRKAFTGVVNMAWVKIYSRMLSVMVPVAVEYELQIGTTKLQRTRPHPKRIVAAYTSSTTEEEEMASVSVHAITATSRVSFAQAS